MKYFAILAGLLVAGCTTQPQSDAVVSQSGFQRIETTAQIQPFLNRRLDYQDGMYNVIRPDGTFEGEFGRRVAGTWQMRDGYWCREITEGVGNVPPSDCQLLEIGGSNLRFTRQKGEGQALDLTLGAPA